MKKVLIINGHPNEESFNHALAAQYELGAQEMGASVDRIDIGQLDFDPNLRYGYQKRMPLEPDLEMAWTKIQEADHIVWVFPLWWSGFPAIMKGFIDRLFLPNLAFRYNGKPFPEQLLKNKSARIVVTSDSPKWYVNWVMRNPAVRQLKKGTLEFCGIKPVKVTFVGPVKSSDEAGRKDWIEKVYKQGVALR